MAKIMKNLLLIVLFLTNFAASAASLGFTKEQFVTNFLSIMSAKKLDASLKQQLEKISFGPSVFSDSSEAAVISNTMIVLADQNKDGVIDNALIIYPAPRGGMDRNDLSVRRGFITTVIGSENAYSESAEYVLSTTGTRRDGRRLRKIDGFLVASRNNDDQDQTQMLVIINESNKHPDVSRKKGNDNKTVAGPDYFSR